MRKAIFGATDLYQIMKDLSENYKFTNKKYLVCAWRDFKKTSLWDMQKFKPKISPIFHFDRVR